VPQEDVFVVTTGSAHDRIEVQMRILDAAATYLEAGGGQ
jgi:hypothetical protein